MKFLIFAILTVNFQAFAQDYEACKLSYRAEAILTFEESVTGYGFNVFELTDKLDQAYNVVVKPGTYKLVAIMKTLNETKKTKGKIRCLYQTKSMVLTGEDYEIKVPSLSNNKSGSWIEFKDGQMRRVGLGEIDLSAVHNIVLPDQTETPALFTLFGARAYGWYREAVNKKILKFEGALTEGNYADGFKDYAKTEITLYPLARQR